MQLDRRKGTKHRTADESIQSQRGAATRPLGIARSTVRHVLLVLIVSLTAVAAAQAPDIRTCPEYRRPHAGGPRYDHYACLNWFLQANRPTFEILQPNVGHINTILNDSVGESVQGMVIILRDVSHWVRSNAERSMITWLLLDEGGDPFHEYEFTNVFERFTTDRAVSATLVAWADANGRSGRGVNQARQAAGNELVAWAANRERVSSEFEAELERAREAARQAERVERERVAEIERLQREAQEREAWIRESAAQDPTFVLRLVQTGTTADLTTALSAGAALTVVDAYGQTPLMYAVGSNTADMARVLIARGADVNQRSAAGWTALHYAVRDNDDLDVIRVLVEAGADPTITNEDGRSPIDLARHLGAAAAEAAIGEALAVRAARVEAEQAAARAEAERARAAAEAQRQAEEVRAVNRARASEFAQLLNEPPSELVMLTTAGGHYGDRRWTHGVGAMGTDDTWVAAWFETRSSRRLYLVNLRSGTYCRWAATPNFLASDSEWMLITQGLAPGYSATVLVHIWSGSALIAVSPAYAMTSNGRCAVDGHNRHLH